MIVKVVEAMRFFSKMKRRKEIEPRRKKTRKGNEDDRKLDG